MFDSPALFQQAFVEGLRPLAQSESDGAFILALANASFNETVWSRLKNDLENRFEETGERYRTALSNGAEPAGPPDDVSVLLRLLVMGFKGLQLTEFANKGKYELQFNQLRAFRPKRMSSEVVKELSKPFDPDGFHFNKPFLEKEVLWQGDLLGKGCRLLYNKFPFADYHGILVADPELNNSQLLTAEYHDYVCELTDSLGLGIPGWGFGYNSYGAYSSVNHLHFQSFVRDHALPLESDEWQHNGGLEPYPLGCHRFEDAGDSWVFIEALHQANRAYNIIYRPGAFYVLPRAMQGSYQHSAWTGGYAWYELAGGLTTFSRDDFLAITEQDASNELAKLSIDS